MDITKYEVLLSAIDRGGFNKACEDLGYTLSGISKMMSSMEKEIGFPLIVRSNKGIALTAEGERVLPLIRQLLKANEILEEEFSLIRGVESGRVRVGSFPTTAFAWMPKILAGFHEQHPGIHMEVVEENSLPQLELWLNQGVIDVGIFSRQPHHSFSWVSLKNDPYVALLPAGHPLAQHSVVSLKALFEDRVILFKSQDGLDQDVIKLMQYVEVKADPSYTTNSDFTVIHMVEQNHYVTILPKLIADYAVRLFNVTARPIDVDMLRDIGIAVKSMSQASPAVKAFVRLAQGCEL